jgi:hypothetical protein
LVIETNYGWVAGILQFAAVSSCQSGIIYNHTSSAILLRHILVHLVAPQAAVRSPVSAYTLIGGGIWAVLLRNIRPFELLCLI